MKKKKIKKFFKESQKQQRIFYNMDADDAIYELHFRIFLLEKILKKPLKKINKVLYKFLEEDSKKELKKIRKQKENIS